MTVCITVGRCGKTRTASGCERRWLLGEAAAAQLTWEEHDAVFCASPAHFLAGLESWSAEALQSRGVVLIQRLMRHAAQEATTGLSAATEPLPLLASDSRTMDYLLAHVRLWEDMAKARALLPAVAATLWSCSANQACRRFAASITRSRAAIRAAALAIIRAPPCRLPFVISPREGPIK